MARYVSLATASYTPLYHAGVYYGADLDARMRMAESLAERAALAGARIVAFPEVVAQQGLPTPCAKAAEDPDGYTLTRAAQAAKRFGIWAVWPLILNRAGRLTNSAVLISPDGGVAGIYDKIHPTVCELDDGIAPGAKLGIFDTDFARIGICICYDLNFPDVMRGLGEAGAEIVFFSSAYAGGLQMQFWSMTQGYYMASAVLGQGAQIVDISGHVLRRVEQEALLVMRLNLDRRYIHMDFNEEKLLDIQRAYGDKVSFEFFTDERRMTIASEEPGLSVDRIIDESHLELQRDYFIRSEQKRREIAGLPEAAPDDYDGFPR